MHVFFVPLAPPAETPHQREQRASLKAMLLGLTLGLIGVTTFTILFFCGLVP